jgi:lipopolysaccharide transport system permease protein
MNTDPFAKPVQSEECSVAEGLLEPSVIIIKRSKHGIAINWRDIWNYRELLYFLTWRDVKVRYKQTALGAVWAILQPLLTMVVFSVFLGHFAGLENKTQGVPYPIFLYTGLLPWTFVARAVGLGGESLVGSQNLITKVYFPRLIIPLAAVGAALVDLAISFVVLLVLMVFYRTSLSAQVLLLPLFLFGTVLTATGVATLFAALTVAFRDFRYILPFTVQLWMFATPVLYPSTVVPPKWHWLLLLNPMAGLIDGFRAALLNRAVDWPQILLSLVVSIIFFLCGVLYFHSVERGFADIV